MAGFYLPLISNNFLGWQRRLLSVVIWTFFAILESLHVNWKARFGDVGTTKTDDTSMAPNQVGALEVLNQVECMVQTNNTNTTMSMMKVIHDPGLEMAPQNAQTSEWDHEIFIGNIRLQQSIGKENWFVDGFQNSS
ncbi:UNVERIFIED_CONTAM: hypothetical protein Sradi_0148100 [Sesamum radiatum]|uniref:Uncharacterized protein n=1 Tax=Sesamum radiatum TaxID=300843 RepID=A0AAW2WJY5_SESRA